MVTFYIDGNKLVRLDKQVRTPVVIEVTEKIKLKKDERAFLEDVRRVSDSPRQFQWYAFLLWKIKTEDKEA